MGKKKFIDKKKAATFSLVFRDTAEEGDPSAAVPIRQFTRVDGGDGYVPGFTEDDPRSQPGDEDWDEEEEQDEDEDEDGEDNDNTVDDHGEESRFDDADESGDVEQEEGRVSRPRQGAAKATVGTSAAAKKGNGLPENLRRELIEMGFPDDGYDYSQHMRTIASTGPGAAFVFSSRAADPLHADVKAYDASKFDVEMLDEFEEAGAPEIIELVSSSSRPVRKPLSKDGVLDADIIAALENSDDSQFNSADELEDEFVIVASVADEGQSSRGVENPTTSSGRRQEGGIATQKQKCDEDLDHEEVYDDEGDDELEETPGWSDRERPTRLLDEQFETLALNEYDDYDDGELEEDDPSARGRADISQFSSVLSEFLDDKDMYSEKYETIAESHRVAGHRASKNTDSAGGKTANTNMLVNVGVEDIVVKKTLELGDRHSDAELVAVEESEEDRDEWDCETVVSTYSNLDNHPAKINAPGKSSLKPKLQDLEKANIIRLTGKQHLPVDYLPAKGDEDKQGGKRSRKEAILSGKLAGPRAGETPADKKARKASIKENRREARLAKKTLKLCYKDDSQRSQRGAATTGPNVIHLP